MIHMNAVMGKELTTRMRGWRAALVVTAYLTVLAAISLLVLHSQPPPDTYGASAGLGKSLYVWLACVQIALIIFITPASTSGAISGERQRQTLDLLLVTRLSSFSVVVGKLVAGLAFDVLLILCSVPLFSMVFLFGGVSPGQFLSLFVTFLVTTVLLGSMALFISTLTRRSGASTILTMLCTLFITAGLALIAAVTGALDPSNNVVGGVSLPLVAYFDPLAGFAATLPDADWITSANHITGGPLALSVWQDQMIVNLVLSALFVWGSVQLLRSRWLSS